MRGYTTTTIPCLESTWYKAYMGTVMGLATSLVIVIASRYEQLHVVSIQAAGMFSAIGLHATDQIHT